MKAWWFIPWLLFLLWGLPCLASDRVVLYYFYAKGCINCIHEEEFLAELRQRIPALEVRAFEVQSDKANASLLVKVAAAFGVQARGVPVTFIGGFSPTMGFQDAETTGRLIEERVRECLSRGCTDVVGQLLAGGPAATTPGNVAEPPGRGGPATSGDGSAAAKAPRAGEPGLVLKLPVLGRIDISTLPLLALTVILGALDSFNPCAFFVLFTLLGILVHARSRKRMFFIGGVFVLFSGIVYFVFMSAWLNIFLYIGELRAVTVAAGVIALCVSAVNIKDFFLFKRGFSLSIPESRKPGLFERMRALLRETSLPAMIFGTVVLALAANTYELLCTAGFPLVFTRILTLSSLRPLEYYFHLMLYNVVYILPLAAVVAVFSWTLGSRKLSEVQGRVMKLVSGLMMLGLGAVVLVDPSLFNNMLVGVGLLACALLVAAAIVGLERWREAAGGVR